MLKKHIKKAALLLSAVATIGTAIGGTQVHAASVAFSGVSFSAVPGNESWKQVTSKVKPNDGDQGWYVSFTSISGDGYAKKTKNTKFLVASSRSSGYNNSDSDLWPIAKEAFNKHRLKNGCVGYEHVPYGKAIAWNARYRLWLVSNQNNRKRVYHITVSGRYSS